MLGKGGVISLVGAGGKTSLMFQLARELVTAGETVLTTTTTKIYVPSKEQSGSLIVSDSTGPLLDRLRDGLRRHNHITAAAGRLSDQRKLTGLAPEVVQEIWECHMFRWIIVEADGAAGRPLKAPGEHEPVIPTCTALCVGMIGLSGVGQPLEPKWVFRPRQFMRLSGLREGMAITPAATVSVLLNQMGLFKSAPSDSDRIAFLNQADVPPNLYAGRQIAHLVIREENYGIKRVVIGQTLFDPPITEIHDPKF
jgi:probable selenium-dependent hydroxylase accessory protein YqeC